MTTADIPKMTIVPALPIVAEPMSLTSGSRSDTTNPEPTHFAKEIGVATLANGRRVINCWKIWRGGYEIVHRFDVTDLTQVVMAARWAAPQPDGRICLWRETGSPVRSSEEVERVFTDAC